MQGLMQVGVGGAGGWGGGSGVSRRASRVAAGGGVCRRRGCWIVNWKGRENWS